MSQILSRAEAGLAFQVEVDDPTVAQTLQGLAPSDDNATLLLPVIDDGGVFLRGGTSIIVTGTSLPTTPPSNDLMKFWSIICGVVVFVPIVLSLFADRIFLRAGGAAGDPGDAVGDGRQGQA